MGTRPASDAPDRGYAITDGDDRSPLGEARPHIHVLLQPLTQSVEPLRVLLVRGEGQLHGAPVHLDTGDDALPLEDLREQGAVRGLLTDGLVKENHAGEVLADAFGGEEHLSVLPADLLTGVDTHRVEALLYGAEALVGGEDALALGD
jgi:sirohydrochlorin ferrochelatase